MASTVKDVVIVGASVAGLSAADTLREDGYEGRITVLSAEAELPYDRPPLSKQALDPTAPRREYLLRPADHYAASGIDLLLDTPAFSLDVDKRTVQTPGGAVDYDRLIIATGSRAKQVFHEDGTPLPTLRTRGDAEALRRSTVTASSVIIIGAGFIGLEVAATLKSAGLDVAAIGFYPLPLDRSIGPQIAHMLRDLHVGHGVRMHSGSKVSRVWGEQGDYRVELADGTLLEAEAIVAGIGSRPNCEWLEESGVTVTDGVPVDAFGRTNVEGVLAAGDVACFRNDLLGTDVRNEHWTGAIDQGRQAAKTALGVPSTPFAEVPYFWTDQYGMKLQSYGRRDVDDTMVVVEGSIEERDFLALHGRPDGRFTAVTSLGRASSIRPYRKLLQARASWGEALDQAGVHVGR